MIDSGRRSDPVGSGGATRPLLMDARRYVKAPLRWTPAVGGPLGPPNPRGWSPSSPILVSTKNLCRGQSVPGCGHRFSVATFFGAESCPCFGRVTMNDPGWLLTILRAEPVFKGRRQYLSESNQPMGGGSRDATCGGSAASNARPYGTGARRIQPSAARRSIRSTTRFE